MQKRKTETCKTKRRHKKVTETCLLCLAMQTQRAFSTFGQFKTSQEQQRQPVYGRCVLNEGVCVCVCIITATKCAVCECVNI